jgi:diaminohydroxyphosphoribosylaminopyrimidine deaminase/5-amino-6-(5-phosphoribosylamino)uracil reductase
MSSEYMRRALALAESVLGTTSPNPSVGCVLVRDGRIIAEGATQPPGGPHAEAVALQRAGETARGATAYVTLAPCAHHGRTPPCVDALIEAGVARVVVALRDVDPVAEGGIERLRQAGVEVEAGDGEAEAARLLEAYIHHRRAGLPFVIVKFAATLDGKIAAATGDSRWVSGEAARAWAHDLRAKVDAIMCGVNNVLLDDPQLTARPGGVLSDRQPLRIVVDSRGRTPATARVLASVGPAIVATTAASTEPWRSGIEARDAEVLVLPAGEDGRVDLRALMQELGGRGVLSLLAEGGGVLHGSLFAAGLARKVHAIVAPKIVGGSAYPAVAGEGARTMADALTLRDVEVERLGDDVLVTGYVPEA